MPMLIVVPSAASAASAANGAAVLGFSLNSSCTPVSQLTVSFAAISAEETTTSQAAASSQPGPSVDSRAAHARLSRIAACSSALTCVAIRYFGVAGLGDPADRPPAYVPALGLARGAYWWSGQWPARRPVLCQDPASAPGGCQGRWRAWAWKLPGVNGEVAEDIGPALLASALRLGNGRTTATACGMCGHEPVPPIHGFGMPHRESCRCPALTSEDHQERDDCHHVGRVVSCPGQGKIMGLGVDDSEEDAIDRDTCCVGEDDRRAS